ncbi:hypothetical protein PIROE2DRAFT_4002, partial [Piromyces sp. E2]
MTILESYPIHRCVYRNDAFALKELLMDEEMKKRIDEPDNHGNTPLNLSLMLDRRNCTIVLLNNNCDIFGCNAYGWNSSDESIMSGDIDIIERITLYKWKKYVEMFSRKGGIMDKFSKDVPTLYFKNKLRLKTTIPLIKRLGLRDVQEIYTRGKSIRFNTTISGIDNRGIPKLIKGSISIIGKFDEKTDNKKKLYQEFFPNIPQWYINNTLKTKIGICTLYKFYFDFTSLEVKQKKNSLIKKTKKTFPLQNGKSYKAELFRSKNFKIIIRKRKDETVIGDCKSIIKTTIKNVDIDSLFKKLEMFDEKKMFKRNNSIRDDNDDTTESDDDSLYSEVDEESFVDTSTTKRVSTPVQSNSIFKKYINEKNPKMVLRDPVTMKKISDILDKGFDENGQEVTLNDISYLEKHAPFVLKKYAEKREFHYDSKKLEKTRYTVSRDGRTKTYEVDDANDTLDWETAYNVRYRQNDDILYDILVQDIHGAMDHKSNDVVLPRLLKYNKKNVMSEEQYFDSSNKDILHMGKIMTIDEEIKNNRFRYKYWVSKENEFPVTLNHFKPLIEFLTCIFMDQLSKDGPEDDNVVLNLINNKFYKNLEADKRMLLQM